MVASVSTTNSSSAVAPLTFLSGANIPFVGEVYAKYLRDPSTVDASWVAYFRGLGGDERAALADWVGASWAPRPLKTVIEPVAAPAAPAAAKVVPANDARGEAKGSAAIAEDLTWRALQLVDAYRRYGHRLASLDPLGLAKATLTKDLQPMTYGLESVHFTQSVVLPTPLAGRTNFTVGELLQSLQGIYCQSVGVEVMHLEDSERRTWLLQQLEGGALTKELSRDEQKTLLQDLTEAEGLENFLQKKYTGTKRFGLEGGESLIPALQTMLRRLSGGHQVREVMLGMAHRGRLNVLTNVMGKPFKALFSEFQGNTPYPESFQGGGDVKYHAGTSSDRQIAGRTLHLSISPNPSHLEAVNAVVQGKVRAKQDLLGDRERRQVVGLLIHGDAAFAGQGSVVEALNLCRLPGYRSGGTLHVIINNQVGFTTSPQYARSCAYASGPALYLEIPVLHVQADDAEAVVRAAALAADYQQRFGEDILIDLICYRRSGHNEVDEPSFTQPLLYKQIAQQISTRKQYAAKLVNAGVISTAEEQAISAAFQARLEADFAEANSFRVNKIDWLEGTWTGLDPAPSYASAPAAWSPSTGVAIDQLKSIGQALTKIPEGFNAHPKILRFLDERAEVINSGKGVNWALAEALAFASLAVEGTSVRLSGQDCGRGTFSQRHAVLTDQTNEARYTSAANVQTAQAPVEVLDSPLSEYAVMGFEYGISQGNPKSLVMWEGQFGDFVNGAQIIIDQFISSAESKWQRMSGLVLLLPHGYEGQGPEHSSCRFERFLQLCAEDNMQVANCSTPANYFHILRRQINRKFRKPLILVTPKSLLRHKLCVSDLAELADGTAFRAVIGEVDSTIQDAKVKRVVLCSGKVYYDLLQERAKQATSDVVLLRLEQFYPFPQAAMVEELRRYPQAEVVWCQEEPENMGAWFFIDRLLEQAIGLAGIKANAGRPLLISRKAASSPAVGSHHRHEEEQHALVTSAVRV